MTEIERLFAESEGRPLSLVFIGKHGREMFVCTDAGEAYNFCLSVLWQRYHSGYYFEEEEEPSLPPLTKEQIDQMPYGETKRGALNEWAGYERSLRWYRDSMHGMEQARLALTQRDGETAFVILWGRRHGEYEEFEIVSTERPAVLPKGDLLQEKPDHTYLL